MNAFLSLDLGGSFFRSALVVNNCIKSNTLIKQPSPKIRTPQLLAKTIAGRINMYRENLTQSNIVLSVAGPVAEDQRTINRLPNIFGSKYANFNLSEMVEEKLNVYGIRAKLNIINDGTAAVLAEMSEKGALSGAEVGFAYIIGTGVGGAAAKRVGEMLQPFALSGFREFGHFPYVLDLTKAVECGCGSRGCIETVSSGPAAERIANEIIEKIGHEYPGSLLEQQGYIDNKKLEKAIKMNDLLALKVLEEITEPTASVVYSLIKDQSEIQIAFVGGFVKGVGKQYLDQVAAHLNNRGLFSGEALRGRLHLGNISPDETNLIGAAEYGKTLNVNK